MSKLPALPLFVDAWVADTAHLTRIERGLYFDLLTLMWRTPDCRVPNDIPWIARRLRCDDGEVEILHQLIAEFCQSSGNWITQKRLRKEYAFVSDRVEKRRDAAKSRWNKEKGECKSISVCNAPTPTPTPTNVSERVSNDTLSSAPLPELELPLPKSKPVLLDMDTARQAVTAYNAMADGAGLPKVQNLTDQRRKHLAHRLKDCGGLDGWHAALAKVAASNFLTGKVRDWRADFDFILQAKSFTKIMEGTYDNNRNARPALQPARGYSAQDALRGLYAELDGDREAV